MANPETLAPPQSFVIRFSQSEVSLMSEVLTGQASKFNEIPMPESMIGTAMVNFSEDEIIEALKGFRDHNDSIFREAMYNVFLDAGAALIMGEELPSRKDLLSHGIDSFTASALRRGPAIPAEHRAFFSLVRKVGSVYYPPKEPVRGPSMF